MSVYDVDTWILGIPAAWEVFIFAAKGGLGVVAVVLLVFTMSKHWSCCYTKRAQRLRYIALLGYAVLVTGASSEQIATRTDLGYRHLGALVMTSFLIYVCIETLRDRCLRTVVSG